MLLLNRIIMHRLQSELSVTDIRTKLQCMHVEENYLLLKQEANIVFFFQERNPTTNVTSTTVAGLVTETVVTTD